MNPSSILEQHPIRLAELGDGVRVAYRASGTDGAVTHVLLADPAKGYGVSIDDMLAASAATGGRGRPTHLKITPCRVSGSTGLATKSFMPTAKQAAGSGLF